MVTEFLKYQSEESDSNVKKYSPWISMTTLKDLLRVFSQSNNTLKRVFWHFVSHSICKKELMNDSTSIVINSVGLQRCLAPQQIGLVISQAAVPKLSQSKTGNDDFFYSVIILAVISTLIGTTVQGV